MTTVIAVETPSGVTFGWDSQITYGHRAVHSDMKVFANSGIVFGVSGDVRYANILRYMDIPDRSTDDTDRYVTNELIPAMQQSLKTADAAKVSDSKIDTDSVALVCVRGRMYDIGSDLSWHRQDDGIYAIGSGANYALGAFKSMVVVGIRRALKAAAELDPYTGGELHVRTVEEILADA